jgi:hypothetical protein
MMVDVAPKTSSVPVRRPVNAYDVEGMLTSGDTPRAAKGAVVNRSEPFAATYSLLVSAQAAERQDPAPLGGPIIFTAAPMRERKDPGGRGHRGLFRSQVDGDGGRCRNSTCKMEYVFPTTTSVPFAPVLLNSRCRAPDRRSRPCASDRDRCRPPLGYPHRLLCTGSASRRAWSR